MRGIAFLFLSSILFTISSHKLRIERSMVTDNSISNGASIYLLSSSSNLYLNEDFIPETDASESESNIECFIVKTWNIPWKFNSSYEKTTGEMQMQGCSTGLWVMAINGGGDNVTVVSKKPFKWETFTYEREGTETLLLRKDDYYLRLGKSGIRADIYDRALAERFIIKKMSERVEPNIYGVNLGGWLVPEKWITPKLFFSSNTTNEYEMCLKLGTLDCQTLLVQHYSTFIRPEEDFKNIQGRGFLII